MILNVDGRDVNFGFNQRNKPIAGEVMEFLSLNKPFMFYSDRNEVYVIPSHKFIHDKAGMSTKCDTMEQFQYQLSWYYMLYDKVRALDMDKDAHLIKPLAQKLLGA